MAGNAPPRIFDRVLLAERRERAARQLPVTFLLDRVADDLADRIEGVLRTFAMGADIGTPGGVLAQRLRDRVAHVETIDISSDVTETIGLADASIDLAVSALALQDVNDLPGLLRQIARALKPDGLFLAVLCGGETLIELRQSFAQAESECEGGVSPRVAPFAEVRDLGALLQRAGFALPVVDVDRITVRYDDVFALMRDLRGMAATNILTERRRTPLRRATLLRMAEIYREQFADGNGRIRATFDMIWLSGWAPHESQQKPLRPGSAKTRLTDVLKPRS